MFAFARVGCADGFEGRVVDEVLTVVAEDYTVV